MYDGVRGPDLHCDGYLQSYFKLQRKRALLCCAEFCSWTAVFKLLVVKCRNLVHAFVFIEKKNSSSEVCEVKDVKPSVIHLNCVSFMLKMSSLVAVVYEYLKLILDSVTE